MYANIDKDSVIQLQVSKDGRFVWLVLISKDENGNKQKHRFINSLGFTRSFINGQLGSLYVTFKPHKRDKPKIIAKKPADNTFAVQGTVF